MNEPERTDEELLNGVKRTISEGVSEATSFEEVISILEVGIKILEQRETARVLSPENIAKLNIPHVDKYVAAVAAGDDKHPEVTADYHAGKIDFEEFIKRHGGGVMTLPASED